MEELTSSTTSDWLGADQTNKSRADRHDVRRASSCPRAETKDLSNLLGAGRRVLCTGDPESPAPAQDTLRRSIQRTESSLGVLKFRGDSSLLGGWSCRKERYSRISRENPSYNRCRKEFARDFQGREQQHNSRTGGKSPLWDKLWRFTPVETGSCQGDGPFGSNSYPSDGWSLRITQESSEGPLPISGGRSRTHWQWERWASQIIVKLQVTGGRVPLSALLDTGSEVNAISLSYAKQLRLAVRPTNVGAWKIDSRDDGDILLRIIFFFQFKILFTVYNLSVITDAPDL